MSNFKFHLSNSAFAPFMDVTKVTKHGVATCRALVDWNT